MSKQDTSKESLEALMQMRQASQEYDNLKKQLVREELQAILNELPEKEDFVELEGVGAQQVNDYANGYNECLQEVKSIIEKRLSDG